MSRQCPSCGGFCKRSGCERVNDVPQEVVVRQLVEAAEQMCHWARSQAKAQNKGGHETFDLMVLQENCDVLETALAAAKEAGV